MTTTTRSDAGFDLDTAVRELRDGIAAEANFHRVFARYYPWVRSFFCRRGYSADDAEDLAQDTFFQVFRQIGSFRGEGSFTSWLFALAANVHRNRQRDLHRLKRSAHEFSLDTRNSGEEMPFEARAPGPSAAAEAFRSEREQALSAAVQGLPPQMRQVLTLRIRRELRYQEIAALLKISVETVKAHLFQARQRLRLELGEDYAEWEE
jgi:RNA polymerase sigma-70 factor (ECF subfamily)